ncbi:N-acetyl-gamma-glutamyl-phosphate reductase [Roseofilum sp. Guam]|uniref:N-acetyl-gamma-glutamyl-phosphate reductase n=1 Tax=Roseofilum sp. Guam TaxID=2821502 RepID=UPI001B23BE03|nr:N-acetyl-gamma-glutamyl-phosphate reductase [Roseofilum sp. Guam]MBP0029547.1 N-acetyl-gamma-glutamyl-phosphate reductase [Roseofilum sp. Guam]
MGDNGRTTVGIVGASGYGGVQLVRMLCEHPNVDLVYLGGDSSAGKSYGDIYPHLAHRVNMTVEPVNIDTIASRCEVVFLGLPNGLACKIAPQLLERGCLVLDLSADYRLTDMEVYKTWYGSEDRGDYEVLSKAVYGLPEIYRDRIPHTNLIACPGCYTTSSLLAIAPLLKQGLIEPDTLIVDAKSGTSGGGRQGKINLLLAEADSSLAAYGVTRHRHTPELEQVCSDLAGHEVKLQFTPHLIPMVRGILATVYATLRDPGLVREDIRTIYSVFYQNSPWVRVLPNGTYPQTKWACDTNLCYLGLEVDARTNRVIVMSAIDNLIKGQAGQAIQCLNLIKGWQETLGLPKLTFYP